MIGFEANVLELSRHFFQGTIPSRPYHICSSLIKKVRVTLLNQAMISKSRIRMQYISVGVEERDTAGCCSTERELSEHEALSITSKFSRLRSITEF